MIHLVLLWMMIMIAVVDSEPTEIMVKSDISDGFYGTITTFSYNEDFPDLYSGFISTYGNMFNIEALQDITVYGMDVHASSSSKISIKVYTREGSFEGYERKRKEWTLVHDQSNISTQGVGVSTPLGDFENPIKITKGSMQAFYVTSSSSVLFCSHGKKSGKLIMSNSEVSFYSGTANMYEFNSAIEDFAWNGNIKYSLTSSKPMRGQTSEILFPDLFTGFISTYGNMFDVEALQDITIHGMDVHVSSLDTIPILVYTKEGSFLGYEHKLEHWSPVVGTNTVKGQGMGNATPLPNFPNPVKVAKGSRQAFYVTSTSSILFCTNGIKTGRLVSSNSDMSFFSGTANVYNFASDKPNFAWNGNIKYKLSNEVLLPPPTIEPTRYPTHNPTGKPTRNPTRRPTRNPTRSPTRNPTRRPTRNPTRSPTRNPTRSPTRNPTRSPTRNPTRSPTRNPTKSPTRNPTRHPTSNPTRHPTREPTMLPTRKPSERPTHTPSKHPTYNPTDLPTFYSTFEPSEHPTDFLTNEPSGYPSYFLTYEPSESPTHLTSVMPQSIVTDFPGRFDGNIVNYGNMFDIMANQDITLYGLDVHAVPATFSIKVYAREGSFIGYERKPYEWELIHNEINVNSQGFGKQTTLRDFTTPIKIARGSTQAFYVTSTSSVLLCTYGIKTSRLVASNTEMSFYSGTANMYDFKRAKRDFVWNGNIRYALTAADDDSLEGLGNTGTMFPTEFSTELSTEFSTQFSTSISFFTSAPTANPTNEPTPLPTPNPTHKPTNKPSPVPSPSPTIELTPEPKIYFPNIFDGSISAFGHMFNIKALQDITLYGFDVHAAELEMFMIKIYTREGGFKGNAREPEMWELVHEQIDVIGQGQGNPTPLRDFVNPINITSGSTQAIYITSTSPSLLSSIGRKNGDLVAANADMKFYAGTSNIPEFEFFIEDFTWNGSIKYKLQPKDPTAAPSRSGGFFDQKCIAERFIEWDNLPTISMRTASSYLGYDKQSWNVPYGRKRNNVENKSWVSLSTYEVKGAQLLGFEQEAWDCQINHYEAYTWDELKRKNVDDCYIALGFDQQMWESGGIPQSYEKYWSELNENEIYGARCICYFRDLWDTVPLNQQFGSGACSV